MNPEHLAVCDQLTAFAREHPTEAEHLYYLCVERAPWYPQQHPLLLQVSFCTEDGPTPLVAHCVATYYDLDRFEGIERKQ